MSLTETSDVFASAHETAINDVLVAITTARPHLLSYGSPAFTPVATVDDTPMAAIPFPGTGGIEWHIRLSTPVVDLFDEDRPLPPELTLPPGSLSVQLAVELCVDCSGGRGRDRQDAALTRAQAARERALERAHAQHDVSHDPASNQPKDQPQDGPKDKPQDNPWKPGPGRARNPLCCKLEVFAVGHLVGTSVGSDQAVAIAVDALEIVDITPTDLENVLERLLTTILRAVLADIRLPLTALRAGMFTLTPTQLPTIDADTVSVRGNL